MATLLYPDFLENHETFDAVQMMWQEWFDTLALENHFSYKPYINMYLRNGEKDRDGNPIFSALVEELNRGVRIIQDDQVKGTDLFISGWLDDIELEEEKTPLDELVIPLILSEETKVIAEELIYAWLVEQVDKESMQELLHKKAILIAE
ncbi:MAG: hypothetical protein IPJ74_27495 [Saprospiraceae bacterium]|nr:hypothetical protein [Saprospiraceae bacterium]